MPSYHMISRGSHHFDFVIAARKYLAGAGESINMPWRVLGNDEIDGTLEGVSKVGKRSVRATAERDQESCQCSAGTARWFW